MTHINPHDIEVHDTERQPEPSAQVPPVAVVEKPDDKKNNGTKKSGLKRVLSYFRDKDKRADFKRTYHLWQLRPHEVAPQSETTSKCSSCSTEFQGNYCPRCGQASSVGKFSFKKALLHFLDVWGMGNRSMFRTIRDLIFRPGYMIRDYLDGKQSAYFPPFKMFFILMTISILIEPGFSFEVEKTSQREKSNYSEVTQNDVERSVDLNIKLSDYDKQSVLYKYLYSLVEEMKNTNIYSHNVKFLDLLLPLWYKNPAIFSLLMLLVFYWPIYFLFQHSPSVPNLSFSEFVVLMVYTSNSYSIFSMLGSLLRWDVLYIVFNLIAYFMVLVSISQFTGFKKWRVLVYLIFSNVVTFALLESLLWASASIGMLH